MVCTKNKIFIQKHDKIRGYSKDRKCLVWSRLYCTCSAKGYLCSTNVIPRRNAFILFWKKHILKRIFQHTIPYKFNDILILNSAFFMLEFYRRLVIRILYNILYNRFNSRLILVRILRYSDIIGLNGGDCQGALLASDNWAITGGHV